MAYVVASSGTNLNDTDATMTYSWTGASTGTNWYNTFRLKVRGVTIAASVVTVSAKASGSSSFNISSLRSDIYAKAVGGTFTVGTAIMPGVITVESENWYDDTPFPIYSSTSAAKSLTFNYRFNNLSLTEPTTANPWNIDSTTGNTVTASWTRSYTPFYARLKGYVNGSLVFNRYGFTSSTTMDVIAYGYKEAIIAAMSGVSPADFRLDIITQFDDGTSDYFNLPYTGSEGTNRRSTTDSITYTFVQKTTISTSAFTIGSALTQIPYTLNILQSGSTNTIRVYINSVEITSLTQTGVTTNGTNYITVDAAKKQSILTQIPNSSTGEMYMTVETFVGAISYGTNPTAVVTATVSDDYNPTVSAIRSELTSGIQAQLAAGVYLKSKSAVRFAVTGAAGYGATISKYEWSFASQGATITTSSASLNIDTATLSTYGTNLSATIKITDSRTKTYTWTATGITILNYIPPNIISFDVQRSTNTGVLDPLGNYAKYIFNISAGSVIYSATERNRVKYKLQYFTTIWNDISTSTGTEGVLTANTTYTSTTTFNLALSYPVRILVYDDFFVTDNDYISASDTLAYGKVAMMLGDDYVSIGKIWSQGALDVGGDIYANGIKVSTTATTPVVTISASQPGSGKAGDIWFIP